MKRIDLKKTRPEANRLKLEKYLSFLLVLCILIAFPLQNTSAAAPEIKIPSEFWKLAPLYQQAVDKNDPNSIILYGSKIVALFNGAEETQKLLEIVAPRLDKVARAYEALGSFDKAVEFYGRYIPLAEKLGWADGVAYARSKVAILSFDIELYTRTQERGSNPYYGAKYEPVSGLYFGSCYDLDPRIEKAYSWNDVKNSFPKKNSAYLLYLVWESDIAAYDSYYQGAKADNIAVQLSWNIPDASIDSVLKNISSYDSYINTTAEYLGELNIPVFLRFACEMNIKDNCKDSAAYIEAFRHVARIMKTKAPNVAMVWSPNDISAKGRTYDQYYPGDEYVDWVGISTYTELYFQGRKDWGAQQDSIDSVFMTGSYTNPLARIKSIMDTYGARKPVMICETGVGHHVKSTGENLEDWASAQLRRLYVYAPMVYPQLKGMFYFNANSESISGYSDYSLYGSSKLNTLYNELVAGSNFLTEINEDQRDSYRKITYYSTKGFKLELFTYTIVPKVLNPSVQYKLDGKSLGITTAIPYSTVLDVSAYPKGQHLLSVEVSNGAALVGSREYVLTINSDNINLKRK